MFNSYSIRDISIHTKPLADVKWNCDGSLLATAGYDKNIKIHSLDNSSSSASNILKLLQTITCTSTPTQLCWHPNNNNKFAIISDERNVEIWEVKGRHASMKINSLGGNINISWSIDGKYLAVGNKADNLIILEVATGKQLKKYKFNYGKEGEGRVFIFIILNME